MSTSRIVVAEDDPGLRTVYETWLRDRGESVVAVPDGNRAIEAVSEDTALLICDRDMPERCGAEVVAAVGDADVTTVVVSAKPPDETLCAADVEEYLVKPVSREEFEAVIDRHVC
ncbi:MAG: two-component system response regulator [Halobacteriaceae archaeon]